MSWSEEPTQAIPPVRGPSGPDKPGVGVYIAGGIGLLILLAVVVWVIASGGDDTTKVATPKRSTTTTSSTTLPTTTTTLPPTTTTTATTTPITIPPTTVTPGTVITNPPTTAATTTAPATTTTTTGPTTTTTKPKPKITQLREDLEASLTADGEPPPPGAERIFKINPPSAGNHARVTVFWEIDAPDDDSIPIEAAWQNAADLLAVIKDSDVDYQRVTIRGRFPVDDNADGVKERRVVMTLRFTKETLESIDFNSIDPLDLAEIANDACLPAGSKCATFRPAFDPTTPDPGPPTP